MFEMNFSVKYLFVSMLIVTSLGIEFTIKNSEEECSKNNTRYLITARKGMRFYKKVDFYGLTDITYDCTVGNPYTGTIDLDDEEHPRFIDSLFIKNCGNLTVYLRTCEHKVKSLQITGVEEVRIVSYEETNDPEEIVITDVEMLKWSLDYISHYRYCFQTKDRSLILKNVAIEDFNYNSFKSLYMTGVKAEGFVANALFCSLLNITDSHFGHLKINRFAGNAIQAYIVNNTFERVYSDSFDLRVNESFVFSGNHVKQMLGTFQVAGPKVEIVGNAFDYGEDTFFKIHLIDPNYDENTIVSLNVSSNRVKSFHKNLVELNETSVPQLITIEGNQFNCSCATSLYLEKLVKSSSESIITKMLLDAYMNNICFNFGNCPLRKLLGKDVNVCSNTFVCPEDSSEVSDTALKGISLEILKNLTEALHLFMDQNQKFKYSDKTSTENYNVINNF